MRDLKSKMLTTSLALLLAGVVSVSAQMSDVYGVKMTTSFPFTVNNVMLPAGDYKIRRLGMRESKSSLILQGEGRKVMLNTVAGLSNGQFVDRTEVVFENIGGQYFLAEVRSAGSEAGARIVPSRSYRRLMASSRPVRRIVVSTSDTGF
jgi:hypothetical protein